MTAEQKLAELQQRYALFRVLVHTYSPDVAEALALKHATRVVLDTKGEAVLGNIPAIVADISAQAAHQSSDDLAERFLKERNAAAAARPNVLAGFKQ